MPLDVWGRRRATMKASTCVLSLPERVRETAEPPSCQGSGLAILACERGIPSKHESPVCVDQVPVLYTHRSSLLPIRGRHSDSSLGMLGEAAAPLGCWRAAGRVPNLNF